MSNIKCNLCFVGWTLVASLLSAQSAFSEDYSKNISEEYLRSQFSFATEDKLKYSQCKKNSYPTCTYVWGVESDKDAAREKHGLAPKGSKLQIVYAQAKSKVDFQRVLASYNDAEQLEGLGVEAVWSAKRNQLSLITEDSLIMHISIQAKGAEKPEATAVSIAKHLLGQR